MLHPEVKTGLGKWGWNNSPVKFVIAPYRKSGGFVQILLLIKHELQGTYQVA